jgi:hypothetical protein
MTKGHSAACAPGDDAGDAHQPHLRMGSSSKLAPEAARKAHLFDLMAIIECCTWTSTSIWEQKGSATPQGAELDRISGSTNALSGLVGVPSMEEQRRSLWESTDESAP